MAAGLFPDGGHVRARLAEYGGPFRGLARAQGGHFDGARG